MTLVPMQDAVYYGVDWSDMSEMKTIRCRNHPTSYYLTKNPTMRTLHFVEACREAYDMTIEERQAAGWTGVANLECPCPASDLAVEVDPANFDEMMAALALHEEIDQMEKTS